VTLEDQMTFIDLQLDEANMRRRVNGEYADPTWYYNAKAARKIKGRQVHAVLYELSRRKRQMLTEKQEIRQKVARTFEHMFVDICHELLDQDIFEWLKSETHARLKSESK
jgi:hypothetical protein